MIPICMFAVFRFILCCSQRISAPSLDYFSGKRMILLKKSLKTAVFWQKWGFKFLLFNIIHKGRNSMIRFNTTPRQESAHQKVRLIVSESAKSEQAQKKAQLESAKVAKAIKTDAIPAINAREKHDLESNNGVKTIDILSQ